MKGERQLKAMWNDPRMKELIDSLWREYPVLYNERYDSDPDKWLMNFFGENIEFGQALGQDHAINGNQSTAIGIGGITRTFRELVLGSYPTEDPLANPDEWNLLDRLLTVGKGITVETREDALILFKSGLLKLFSAVQISAFPMDELGNPLVEPEPGTLQYTAEKSLELFENEKWKKVGDKNYLHFQESPSRVWEITHNLDKYPTVTILDPDRNEYEAAIKHMDHNFTVITFSEAFAGFAEFN